MAKESRIGNMMAPSYSWHNIAYMQPQDELCCEAKCFNRTYLTISLKYVTWEDWYCFTENVGPKYVFRECAKERISLKETAWNHVCVYTRRRKSWQQV